MSDKIFLLIQYLIPQHLLSRLMGYFGNRRWRWFKNFFIKTFIKIYQVDMSKAVETNSEKYSTFNDFFTRALKPDARVIVQGNNEVACPVDGYVSQATKITENKIFQAKSFNCTLQQLLANDAEIITLFQNGEFATLYLAPKNYHRVHMPLDGVLKKMLYVPGKLFSVNPTTVNHVPGLFARNERVISIFDTNAGPMAVILVGAMIVASIETVWAGEVAPRHPRQIQQWDYTNSSIKLLKGEEMGRFKMGSTVIVLFGPDRVTWAPTIQPEKEVRLGQLLGITKYN